MKLAEMTPLDKVRVGLLVAVALVVGVGAIYQFTTVNPQQDAQLAQLQDIQDGQLATAHASHVATINSCRLANVHLVRPIVENWRALRSLAAKDGHPEVAAQTRPAAFSLCKRKFPFGRVPTPPFYRRPSDAGLTPGEPTLTATLTAAHRRRHLCRHRRYRRHHRRCRRHRHRHHHNAPCIVRVVVINGRLVKICVVPLPSSQR